MTNTGSIQQQANSIHPEQIPKELQALPQWVGWNFEHRDGKPTKVLKNPRTGRNASSTDRTTWNTLPEALAAVPKFNLAGIGFVFTPEDPYCGIDLDNCRDTETGALAPWASEIIDLFLGAYVEASPSGTGVHIICRGKAPHNGKTPYKGGAVEMYDQDRYFTVTGVAL